MVHLNLKIRLAFLFLIKSDLRRSLASNKLSKMFLLREEEFFQTLRYH